MPSDIDYGEHERDWYTAQQWFVPFKELGVGESFGELALEGTKYSPPPTRAATMQITSKTPAILGSVTKEDYHKYALRVQNKVK